MIIEKDDARVERPNQGVRWEEKILRMRVARAIVISEG